MPTILPKTSNALAAAVLAVLLAGASAKEAAPAAADPVLEERMLAVASELRCLVCQNQTIADSHADLAVDLRNQVRDMLRKGQSEREIIDYMTARYGDFVLYRPPVKATTALLWYGPGLLLVGGLAVLWLVLRRRSRMAPENFDPDEPDLAEASADAASPAPPAQ
jgi:cytochrome c-type biogenesis protein CcmH